MLKTEIKEENRRWKDFPYSQICIIYIGKNDYTTESNIFNAILLKISVTFFTEVENQS
jgi:hypothetical protein